MNALSLKQNELSNLIFKFNLNDIEKIESILRNSDLKTTSSNKISLAGIWDNLYLDNIDLDSEIRSLRKNIFNNLDNKEL